VQPHLRSGSLCSLWGLPRVGKQLRDSGGCRWGGVQFLGLGGATALALGLARLSAVCLGWGRNSGALAHFAYIATVANTVLFSRRTGIAPAQG